MTIPQLKSQAPGFYRMLLGDFVITALSDGTAFHTDQRLMNIPRDRVERLLAEAHMPRPVETSINAFLIHTGSRLVLVDTGAGSLFGPVAGKLPQSLRAAGYQPEQIDTILLTHIHGDHSGGLVVDGQQIFPKAVVHVDKHDSDFWLSDAQLEKAEGEMKKRFQAARTALEPYVAAGRLQTFEGETSLMPGLRALPARGHTPGHSLYAVESQGQKLVLWGDLVHVAAVQLVEPSATVEYDVDPRAAADQRARVLAEASREGYWIAADHISFPGLGHVRAQGPGYQWVPINYSALHERSS